MVYRVYVEKRSELANEAKGLLEELRTLLGIEALESVRLLNRYDVEGISQTLFDRAVQTVLSEPQLDVVTTELSQTTDTVFAVEYLPGQYDQRADSAEQCMQILSAGERPTVRTAKVYLLGGKLTPAQITSVKKYVINPVDSREAAIVKPNSLSVTYPLPETVETLTGFCDLTDEGLAEFLTDNGLAMDLSDLACCRDYFRSERRDPTITEIKMIDTYWSDHCRHTTFNTVIDRAEFEDPLLQRAYENYLSVRKELHRTKPVTLMDMGTLAAKYLRVQGKLSQLDESEEINACTVKIKVNVDGADEDWLLLFKNETHNHPTEIEPFGGAATCIGGAIRDPLSGRSYVYAAMRVTGAADPLRPLGETLPGKLPQRKIVTTAAAGYASYGTQIGLATGQVDELYHDGYAAKRMEIGAVIGAVPARNVRREVPIPGDVVILLGGRTGRDGCGGATGASKSHTVASLESCGAEVQKGNAPEERKLQRLFRNAEAARMIKRCNDFGAGGVSVAVGELADGLDIDLDAVPKKYEGLDGTELAISESQERMAVVVAAGDETRFCEMAAAENLEATRIAVVKADPRLTMAWKGHIIVDIARSFLDTDGAEKHITVHADAPKAYEKDVPSDFSAGYTALAGDLNVCSKRGLAERFDSTIGGGTVLMPFGGQYQLTPTQVMVSKIAVERQDTDTCSLMAWGYNPYIGEKSPYHGAYLAVVESVSKLMAAGASPEDVYLTFQEYFEKPGHDPRRWGKPLSALLGAFEAQMGLGMAAIGGKDSMSGSFESLDVPPTLVSFAVTTAKTGGILSNHMKGPGHRVVLMKPEQGADGLPTAASLLHVFAEVHSLISRGKVLSAYTPTYGGIAEAVMKMCFGNGVGFRFAENLTTQDLFSYCYGSFILELSDMEDMGIRLGETVEAPRLSLGGESVDLEKLLTIYEGKLENVYPCHLAMPKADIPAFSFENWQTAAAPLKTLRPRVLIPVFPGTNCEYDAAKAFAKAGAEPEIIVLRNLTAGDIADSVDYFARRVGQAQMIFLPGGFSGGDEPDGSGKCITSFFRSGAVTKAVNQLLNDRKGLMAGICNGFQALIKLGLVPYGEIIDTDADCPTLTYNVIGRHQSRLVRTRIASNLSPWLAATKPGEIYTVPISHGEGRFYCSDELIRQLAQRGQIATQYVDLEGSPTMDIRFNPNGSACAVEGITSPDGRIFGKMGHSERIGADLYKNVPGDYDSHMFRSAVLYFE
ncbi:MAG: phosphoribosylformylglycinamidine synthase [Clostridiales bacterium]|nr:phosphoribosylformylglycinamidine synthase [Clostridiales bacterium]